MKRLIGFLLLLVWLAFTGDVWAWPSGGASAGTPFTGTQAATLGDNAVTIDATCTGWSAGGALAICGVGNTNGWCCTPSTSIGKTADGTTALTYDAGEADGTTFKIVYTLASLSAGNITVSAGGITLPVNSTSSTFTTYATMTSTANLTFTPSATGVRVTLSAVSVQAVTNGVITGEGGVISDQPMVSRFGGSSKYKAWYVDPFNLGAATTTPGYWYDISALFFYLYSPGGVQIEGTDRVVIRNHTYNTSFYYNLVYQPDGILGNTDSLASSWHQLVLKNKFTTAAGTVSVLTACGDPDTHGVIATGSSGVGGTFTIGASGTGCVVTFGAAFTNGPSCWVQAETIANLTSYVVDNAKITVVGLPGIYHYGCIGLNE